MKYLVALTFSLGVVWFFWSGHTEPFLLTLGGLSCVFVVWICSRMRLLDAESVPIDLRWGAMAVYLPWLAKEVVKANVDVARRIVAKDMPIRPQMVDVYPTQSSELGRVILANSITLTPGTVSVDMQSDRIRVHALSAAEAEEDASGEMDRRVSSLEKA